MGGNATPYLIPAAYTGMSSYDAHRKRPSSEPGTDYYMPTGTPLGAPTRCRVVEVGGSIHPATGRFVTFDDGTRWLRALHLSEWRCKVGDELEPGDVFGLSGASGYGSEFFGQPSRNAAFRRDTGGDHVHMTAFRRREYEFGTDGHGSVDFHALTGGKIARQTADADTPEEENKMKALLIHVKLKDGTDPWFVVDYAAGTAARMREGIQLDIARDYGGVVEVSGVQPGSAITGLTIVNG